MPATYPQPLVVPQWLPKPGCTKQDVDYALHRATAYLRRGGDWEALRANGYVDEWLDQYALLETPGHELVASLDAGLPAVAQPPGGSPAEDGA